MSIEDIIIERNQQLTGAGGRPFLLDYYYLADGAHKPMVLFAHGYKGFKDWGHWGQIARSFAEAGYIFIKFNFSHNGTTIANPLEFDDLEAFGQNNYSRELADLEAVLVWLHGSSNTIPAAESDLKRIALIGHSRGGATSIVKAASDERIKALATWASVSTLDYAWNEALVKQWEKEGVYYIKNGRTGQQMPMYWQMYQDYQSRREWFDVEQAMQRLQQPMLIVHGTDDPAVPEAAAHTLKGWNESAQLHLIDGADHVFGGSHPFGEKSLPAYSEELVAVTIRFFDETFKKNQKK